MFLAWCEIKIPYLVHSLQYVKIFVPFSCSVHFCLAIVCVVPASLCNLFIVVFIIIYFKIPIELVENPVIAELTVV